eukprot:9516585-Karenia_brevis.AAC.1
MTMVPHSGKPLLLCVRSDGVNSVIQTPPGGGGYYTNIIPMCPENCRPGLEVTCSGAVVKDIEGWLHFLLPQKAPGFQANEPSMLLHPRLCCLLHVEEAHQDLCVARMC